MKRMPLWLSAAILVLVLFVGGKYLVVDTLRMDPLGTDKKLTVILPAAGTLMPGVDVTRNGAVIGRVESVEAVHGGVAVAITYRPTEVLTSATKLSVQQLSILGEPVLAFSGGDGGKAYHDGARVARLDADLPTSVPELLQATSELVTRIDVQKVRALVSTLVEAMEGASEASASIGAATRKLSELLQEYRATLPDVIGGGLDVAGNYGRLRPFVQQGGPALGDLILSTSKLGQSIVPVSEQVRGAETLVPGGKNLDHLFGVLNRNLPALGTIGTLIRPTTKEAGPMLGIFDFGALLNGVLRATQDGNVHINGKVAGR